MDSYHAPYKAKHRYWPGLLLVFRFVLLLVFAFEFNPQRDSGINLLAILVATGVLVVWAWLNGGVYRFIQHTLYAVCCMPTLCLPVIAYTAYFFLQILSAWLVFICLCKLCLNVV